MATSDVQILAKGTQAAPLDYLLADHVELLLKMVQATFTDASASGNWLPCVTLISDSGDVLGRAVDQGVKVTAGNDAEVSWFPGVKPAAAAAPAGGGIQFDTFPQAGDWLYAETTDPTTSPNGNSLELYDSSALGGGVTIHSDSGNLNLFCNADASLAGQTAELDGSLTAKVSAPDIILTTSAQVKMEQTAGLGGQEFTVSGTGGLFRVKNHLGSVVFEARGDGSLHGKTGGSLVFDL